MSELKTAAEIIATRVEKSWHPIPPITHPLGDAWEQPDRKLIEIDDTHALMSLATFRALKEYSGSYPSGVYEGKMWRRNDGLFDRHFRASGGKPTWLLMWFGHSDKPDHLSNNSRKIILTDADIDSLET